MLSLSFPKTYLRKRGAALVVVLSLLLLLAILLVAFMTSTRSDLLATEQYAKSQETLALSETATNLVMAQIREATLAGITSTGEGRYIWASQPGAIRVWDNSGNPAEPYLYKLYSASTLKEDNMDFLSEEIPNSWWKDPDHYVDLNEPVYRNNRWYYPILNPEAIGKVEGFSTTQTGDPAAPWDTRTSMPVRWIYMDKNGGMSDQPSNDCVGRLAFWTDDETNKVNINTASAGADESPVRQTRSGTAAMANRLGASFWTTPYTRFSQDNNFAVGGPRQDEFQRYASHPASINLIPILFGPSFTASTEVQRLGLLRNLFDVFPRYKWGGSENQRILFYENSKDISGNNQKHERLYASVDEYDFSPSRQENSFPNIFTQGGSSEQERLDQLRFFITTTSRAPDTNLFGQPRISLWPISGKNDILHRTTQDQLIAFCSTVGQGAQAKEYFFQRLYPFSQTADWTEFPRNQKVFEYLRRLTSTPIPGFGGNFKTKYDATMGGFAGEMDQILTAMFDFIRVVNLNETFNGRPGGFQSFTPDTPGGKDTAETIAALNQLLDSSPPPAGRAGAGLVLPILTPYGRGAGRVPVLSEATIFMMRRKINMGTKDNPQWEPSENILSGLLFETFSPMQGYMPWTPRDFQIFARTSAQLNGEEIFPGAFTGIKSAPFNRTTINRVYQPMGGTDGFGAGVPHPSHGPKYVFGRYNDAEIPAPDPQIALDGGPLEVQLIMKTLEVGGSQPTPSPPYQEYSLDFPSVALPKPIAIEPNPDNSSNEWIGRYRPQFHMIAHPEDVAHSLIPRDGDYRIIAYLQNVPNEFFIPHPKFGTINHFAHTIRMRRDAGWTGGNAANEPTRDGGSDNGMLVGLPYLKEAAADTELTPFSIQTYYPDISPDITDLVLQKGWEGDWNNGLGNFPDGAYLNKPDEGANRMEMYNLSYHLYYNYDAWSQAEGRFSPTLAIPSAIAFGSIPTAVKRTENAYKTHNYSNGRPWRTLLFCPNPDVLITAGRTHFGAEDPPDYLLADFFNLPVIEPYAISEPLSTAGRVNMNYQILPFTGITRATALYALLAGQRVSAIPNSASLIMNDALNNNTRIHHEIDAKETLQQFEDHYFSQNKIFRSATEICSIFFIPKALGLTAATIKNWWKGYRLTGDNLRELPYKTSYPLLTTKSNTYTVHMIAQTINVKGTKVAVTGEYRGSTTIERYVDPGDSRLGTLLDPDKQSLEPLYRFRIVDTKRFAP